MFAGGNLEFIRTAKVGEVLIRKSRVVSVVEKSGRSGKLVFVSVAHEIMSEEGPLINETQNLVYREGERFGPTPLIMDPRAKETSWNWSHELMMDSALMFRFSALTYNAHRIHYDRDYASRVEGYPDLVVQGPLLAVVLAEICRRNVGSRDLERFVFQVHSPSFVGGSVHFKGRLINTDNVELLSFSEAGQLTVSALATFRVGGEEY
jgi:3-methylfumaryl-CoA hydratase